MPRYIPHYRSHVCRRCGHEEMIKDLIVDPYECPSCRLIAEEERIGILRSPT